MRAGFSERSKGYQASWASFNNSTGEARPIGSPVTSAQEQVQAPSGLPGGDGSFVKVSVHAVEPLYPPWSTPVDVYFRRAGGAWRLVGVERGAGPK